MSVVIEARNRGGLSLAVIFLEILPAALVVLLLAAVGVLHVTSRVLVVKMGYELSRLDAQSAELQRQNDALKLELATLKSPSRIEAFARGKLGLVPPPAYAVVHLESRPAGMKPTPLPGPLPNGDRGNVTERLERLGLSVAERARQATARPDARPVAAPRGSER